MALVGDDCYFFCTSTCAKGAACPFRHVEAAKTCKIICQHWQSVGCLRPMCKFRHSDFPMPLNYDVQCYWETQPAGCSRPNCLYKHTKPRPNVKTDSSEKKPESPSNKTASPQHLDENESAATNAAAADRAQFVMPIVKPVIIDPDSEASNSSPVKNANSKIVKHVAAVVIKKADLPDNPSKSEKSDPEPSEEAIKKPVKKVTKVKKVLKAKNGKSPAMKSATGKAVVKKKKVTPSPVTPAKKKVPVKRKNLEETGTSKPAVPLKKKVKDRLGLDVSPVSSPKKVEIEEEEDSSASDSDDSIENVKVLSMEEIFRQKALESMMKKRAAEGKPMLPEFNRPKPVPSKPVRPVPTKPVRPVPSKPVRPVPSKPVRPVPSKSVKPVVRAKPIVKKPPSPEPESESDEEQDEEEEEEKEEEIEDGEVEEDENEVEKKVVVKRKMEPAVSSSESDSSSDSSSDSEEESEVRRVVINLEAEKSARDKAKASLLKRRIVSASAAFDDSSVPTKIKKRSVVKDKTLSMSFPKHSTQLSVKHRLGKPKQISSDDQRLVSRIDGSLSSQESGSDSNDNSISALGQSPVKDRLGAKQVEQEEEKKTRKILLTSDDTPPEKPKRRPWSSKPKDKVHESTEEDDERQVSASTTFEAECETTEIESPFEALRRRALLKKTQQLEQIKLAPNDDEEEVDSTEEKGNGSKKKKKHKHKHKHSKSKKSKKERQIYVPPAKKSSELDLESSEVIIKEKPLFTNNKRKEEDLPDFEEPTPQFSGPPKPKHRVGALWAAGLSAPAKGLFSRPLLRQGMTSGSTKTDDLPMSVVKPTPAPVQSRIQPRTVSTSSNNPVPVVKTFSQIMAEKRQKRAQERPQDDGSCSPHRGLSMEINNKSSSPSRGEDTRPRAPITPIIFDSSPRKVGHPLRSRPAVPATDLSSQSASPSQSSAIPQRPTSAISFNSSSSGASASASMADIRPSYKTARAKKLFKKTSKPASQLQESLTGSSTLWSETQDTGSGDAPSTNSLSSPVHSSPQKDPPVSAAPQKAHKQFSSPQESRPERSISIDDEFSFFDGEMDEIIDVQGKDVEPIDDLLQDIDDLLA